MTTAVRRAECRREVARLMRGVERRNPGESEFHQAVHEVAASVMPVLHQRCVEQGGDGDGYIDSVAGANVAGFVKVADAMLAHGTV